MRKYAIMDGFSVMSIAESIESDFHIEGHTVIDITDVDPQPHIGSTYFDGQWINKPIIDFNSIDTVTHFKLGEIPIDNVIVEEPAIE